jgi:excisionase family DNA binding protein
MEIYQNTVYTVDSLAARWMCSTDVIYDLLRKKKLKGFKIGCAWRINADAVNRFENNE